MRPCDDAALIGINREGAPQLHAIKAGRAGKERVDPDQRGARLDAPASNLR